MHISGNQSSHNRDIHTKVLCTLLVSSGVHIYIYIYIYSYTRFQNFSCGYNFGCNVKVSHLSAISSSNIKEHGHDPTKLKGK